MLERIKSTASFIRSKVDFDPQVGIILGTGLGGLVNHIDIAATLDYRDIPDFPVSTVEGHAGRFIFGSLARASTYLARSIGVASECKIGVRAFTSALPYESQKSVRALSDRLLRTVSIRIAEQKKAAGRTCSLVSDFSDTFRATYRSGQARYWHRFWLWHRPWPDRPAIRPSTRTVASHRPPRSELRARRTTRW